MASIDLAGLHAHWVDLAMLAWLALSMLIGLVRGLIFETFSLLGWGVAYFGAQWAVPLLAPYLPVESTGSALNHAAAFLCAFFAILLGWGLLSRLVRVLVRATPLSLPDRVLGAGFGVMRGLLVLLAIATMISLTPMATSSAWQRSQCATWLNVALQGLRPWLPNSISSHLPA